MRLIDADELKKDNIDYFDSMYGEDCADLFKAILNNAPIIDAELVVHGKWERKKIHAEYYFKGEHKVEQSLQCPICKGFTLKFFNQKEPKYCSMCGAKMEKEGR